jgi:hypothetical protein
MDTSFAMLSSAVVVRHFLPRENNSWNYWPTALIVYPKQNISSSRRRTEFMLDTRTSLALFGSFSSTDYVASQCIRWSYDFILFFSLILIYTIESKLKRSVADLCQHSHFNWSAEHAREAVHWANPGSSHGTIFLRQKSGGETSPWSSFF